MESIFRAINGEYEDFSVSVSMGVAVTDVVGKEYEKMFAAADQALYDAKREGRHHYLFYNNSMDEKYTSSITLIDRI